jgi:hypothetical protein
MKRVLVTAILTMATLAAASLAWAVAPTQIPYQGRLTDAAGTPLNGSFSIRFSIHNLASAGAELYNETQPTVTVTNGLFTVNIGSVTPLTPTVFSGDTRFLEIKVGADAPMTPRQRLLSSPYAHQVANMPGVAGIGSDGGVAFLGTPTTILSQTITVPDAGFVYVTANCQGNVNHVNGSSSIVTVGVSDVAGSFPANQDVGIGVPSGAPSGFYFFPFAVSGLFPVTAGARTFFYLGSGTTGSTNDMQMTCIYFPASYGTVTVAGAQALTPGQTAPDPATTVE